MSNQLQSTTKKIMAFATAFAVVCITFTSCTKKTTGSEASKFIGTWNGTTTCAGSATGGTSVTIGGSGNTVTIAGTAGSGACVKSITATGTASGNTFSMPTQSFTDNCGGTSTLAVAGSLSGSTITVVTTGSAGGLSGTCTFTGTK